MWREGADRNVFARRPRVPQGVAVHVARGRGHHPEPQHTAHRRRVDGRTQGVLLQIQPRLDSRRGERGGGRGGQMGGGLVRGHQVPELTQLGQVYTHAILVDILFVYCFCFILDVCLYFAWFLCLPTRMLHASSMCFPC